MKRNSILLFVMFLALAPLCSAQDKDKPEPDANSPAGKQSIEKLILSREKQAWDAIVKAQGAAFKSVHTDDALIVSPEGIIGVSEFAPMLASLNVQEYSLNDVRVLWANDNTAILVYKALLKEVLADSNVGIGTYYHSSTWVKRGGKWLSTFHHVAPVPPAK